MDVKIDTEEYRFGARRFKEAPRTKAIGSCILVSIESFQLCANNIRLCK